MLQFGCPTVSPLLYLDLRSQSATLSHHRAFPRWFERSPRRAGQIPYPELPNLLSMVNCNRLFIYPLSSVPLMNSQVFALICHIYAGLRPDEVRILRFALATGSDLVGAQN